MSAILKPSPNETAQMMQDEFQRRRQARILQVREQEKTFALRIRRAMQEKQKQEINNLTKAFKKEWIEKHQAALRESEEKFATGLKEVGSAHEQAKENEPNQALADAKRQQMLKTAQERGRNAVQYERELRLKEEEESSVSRKRRHIALIKEKLRARHIASLPPPAPNPADTFLNSTTATGSSESWSTGSIPHHPQRYTTIQISDHNSTMPTTVSLGLPSDAVVERATAAEAAADAREDAVKEGERIQLLQDERDRAIQECMEKAKVRHQVALDRARLDREQKELMNDLKQMKAKDALRRQYHIEYTWDSNTRMTQACNEIFGPPGSKFRESELFSTDLKKDETEDSTIDVEESFDEYTIPKDVGSEERPEWKDVDRENQDAPQPRRHALGRLLKQIELQREQRKKDQPSKSEVRSPSGPQTLNTISSIAPDKTGNSTSSSPEDSHEETPYPYRQQPHEEPNQPLHQYKYSSIPHPTFPTTTSRAQLDPAVIQETPTKLPSPKKTSDQALAAEVAHPALTHSKPPTSVSKGHDPKAEDASRAYKLYSPPKSQQSTSGKFIRAQSQDTTSSSLADGASLESKTGSESVLGRSLESVRNDEALLKSVKDFQHRILQQHKSCAKIQEQIQRLEAKKADLDCLVTDIIKPKFDP